jgi:hypothetical protein
MRRKSCVTDFAVDAFLRSLRVEDRRGVDDARTTVLTRWTTIRSASAVGVISAMHPPTWEGLARCGPRHIRTCPSLELTARARISAQRERILLGTLREYVLGRGRRRTNEGNRLARIDVLYAGVVSAVATVTDEGDRGMTGQAEISHRPGLRNTLALIDQGAGTKAVLPGRNKRIERRAYPAIGMRTRPPLVELPRMTRLAVTGWTKWPSLHVGDFERAASADDDRWSGGRPSATSGASGASGASPVGPAGPARSRSTAGRPSATLVAASAGDHQSKDEDSEPETRSSLCRASRCIQLSKGHGASRSFQVSGQPARSIDSLLIKLRLPTYPGPLELRPPTPEVRAQHRIGTIDSNDPI